MISHFNLLISRLPNILQTSFCTPDESMDQWIMSQPSSMFVARKIKQKLRLIFFWTPCKIFNQWWRGLRINVNRVMEVFEVVGHPPWMVTVLCGWWPSYSGADYSFDGAWSETTADSFNPQRAVTNLNTDLQTGLCFGRESFGGEFFISFLYSSNFNCQAQLQLQLQL